MTSSAPRGRRRQHAALAALGAGLGVAALLAGLLALTGDGTPSGTDPVKQSTAARAAFTSAVAPTGGVASVLLTPTGDDWWAAVTGLAGALRMPQDAPDGAQWYALTTSRTYEPTTDGYVWFPAVYVGFADAQTAGSYHPATVEDPCVCARYVRGKVVTLTPTWVDPYVERYTPEVPGTVPAPARGSWWVDYDETAAQVAAGSAHPDALEDVFTHLGFGGGDLSWTATSPTADGPWTGQLHGWQADLVDLDAVTRTLAATITTDCADGPCTILDPGIADLDTATYLSDRSGGWGNPALAPDVDTALLDTLPRLVAGVDPDIWQGIADQSTRSAHSRVEKVTYTITGDNELTVRLRILGP